MIHDTITIEKEPTPANPQTMVEEGGSNSALLDHAVEEQENNSNESFSSSEADVESMEMGGVDSAGEEDQAEGEEMDLS